MNSNNADRLKGARTKAGFESASDAARSFGWPEPAYRHHENGTRGYDADTAKKYGRAFKVKPGWLLGLESSEKETSDTRSSPVEPSAPNDDTVEIIALDLSLSMGPGTLIDEYPEEERVRISLPFVQAITRTPSDRLRLVRGIGDSMEPTLRTGDRVLVDLNEQQLARAHGVYWIDHLGTHGIKRLRPAGRGRILVMSDNPLVPDFEVPAEELRIEGRVIWFARDL